jgi:hypothetical protein
MKKFYPGTYIYYQDQETASIEKILDDESANKYEREREYVSLILISNFEEEGAPHYPEVGSKWEKRAKRIGPVFDHRERIVKFLFTKKLI